MLNTVGVFSNSKLYEVDSTFGKRLSNRDTWLSVQLLKIVGGGGAVYGLEGYQSQNRDIFGRIFIQPLPTKA